MYQYTLYVYVHYVYTLVYLVSDLEDIDNRMVGTVRDCDNRIVGTVRRTSITEL
jgi:hypothetical protein